MSLHLQKKIKFLERVYDLNTMLQSNKVIVLYGPRQVGKTTLVEILQKKTKLKFFFSSGENGKLVNLFSGPDFDGLIDFAKNYELIIIDEAQMIKNIGAGLKIIVDHVPNIKIVVTGSASFELAGQIGEPLVGRKLTYTLFPVAMMELNKYHSPHLWLEQMLLFGSYPEVLTAETTNFKKQILQEITESYLLKDILAFEKIKNPKILTDLLKLLAWQVGNEVSLRELSNSLKIDYKTVQRYLDLLEKAFIIKEISGYSRNLRKEVIKTKKYYFYDLGIRNSIINNFNEINLRNDRGGLWENYLVMERLKRNEYQDQYANVYFWRTYDQKEIDWVEEREGKLFGYEFKWNTKRKVKEPKLWKDTYPEAEFTVITPENYLEFIL